MTKPNPLEQSVRDQLERYFADLGDSKPRDMLAMVVNCVERPVLEIDDHCQHEIGRAHV